MTAAVVGVGRTEYHRRGRSHPRTLLELVGEAILAALSDAGLSVSDLDGFAYYGGGYDSGLLAQTLGVPEVRFSAGLTGGGTGAAGSVGLAAMAVTSGQADVVVSVMGLQQITRRFGAAFAAKQDADDDGSGQYVLAYDAHTDFIAPSGLVGPSQMFALWTRARMARYGATREHFAEIAIATRLNAVTRPTAAMRTPLTLDDYFNARMVADPLCLYDCCLETDGAVAVVTTSLERARDLRHRPAVIAASAQGGAGNWGQATSWWQMPEDVFASSGHRPVASRLYGRAGVGPEDVDVALLYDHFGPTVLAQLEDYGFCGEGESGEFVASGAIRLDGSIPVNTHGGHLSEAYIVGMTHVVEAVEQIRGTAVNQVSDAEVALVTGGPGPIPVSALVLTS
jgi:acetyl-CoA acetyltransferase